MRRLFLTKTEEAALKRVVRMLNMKPGGFAVSVLYGVAGLGSAIGLAAVSAWLIARASQMPPVMYLTVAATAVRMFGVLRALLRYMQRLASHKVALEGMDSLRLEVYDTLVDGPIDRVARLQRGEVLARTGADIDDVGDFVVKALLPFTVTSIVAVGTVIGFAFLSLPAAAVIAAGLAVSIFVAPALSARSARVAHRQEHAAERELATTTMTLLDSADELAIQGTLQPTFERQAAAQASLNEAKGKASRPAALAAAVDMLAMGLTVVGVILVAAPQTNAGVVSAVALAVLALTPLAAFEGASDLGTAATQLIRSARAAERITKLLGPEVPAEKTHPIPQGEEPTLKAEDLAVGWPGRPTALAGVNLTLRQGDVVGIVGPSGVGKSTLLYTLAGMVQPKSGQASLNGASTWDGDREELTQLVSLTTEDAHVFATTVFENLRVARASLTREEASSMLDTVGLGQWVSSLPNGLDTLLGSQATSISGGERRRLLLARALASPAPLLLLDEPSEHLDTKTASDVASRLFTGADQQRGVLIVSHHLSALVKADNVIQLATAPDPAKPAYVSAQGTHDHLVETVDTYRWAADKETTATVAAAAADTDPSGGEARS